MTTTTDTDDRKQTRPFAAWLQDVRRGELHAELSAELANLAVACFETGKGGTLTLQVKLTPNKDGVTMLAHDTVKVAAPTPERAPALFFVDEEGNATRSDPRQTELPLKSVPVHDDEGGITGLASIDHNGEVKALHG